MATVYKWYPGHYVMGATTTKELSVLLDGIASTTTPTSNIPNLIGVMMRYTWKQLEKPNDAASPTSYSYDFTPILDDLQALKARSDAVGRKLYLRILLMYKGIGGRGAPEYLWKTTNPLYRSEYGQGVYTWGNTDSDREGAINEHPCFWIPAVEARFALFLDAMGAALDSIGRPAADVRYHLSTVDFNETAWGKIGDTPLSSTQMTQQKDALLRLQVRARKAFPTTVVGHFINFPSNGSFSVVNTMCPPMVDAGVTLGGPDTWWNDSSVENGVYKKYVDATGKTAVSPSIQNQNWEHEKHADVTVSPKIYSIDHLLTDDASRTPTLQKLYDRVTTKGVTIDGTPRAGLRGTHITWQAAPWKLHNPDGSFSSIVPWNLIRSFFLNKWLEGPDKGVVSPGVVTAIPSKLETGTAPPPPPPTGTLVLSLTTDTGASNTDKITSNVAVTVTGASSGATLEYATSESGPWSTATPTPAQGSNTWYVRQVVGGTAGVASAPLIFTYDTTVPVLSSATIDGTVLYLVYDDAVNLSNTLRAPISAYQVKVAGVARSLATNFVNEPLKRVKLETGTAVTEGQTVTISYTKPATGTAFTQDLAGNAAANLVDVPVFNLTGLTAPTTIVTITTGGGVADGGYTNQPTPTVAGTLSAPLATGESMELQRSTAGGAFVTVGAPTVTGTTWSFGDATLTEGAYVWRARVRLSELLGPWSAMLSINIDSTPPLEPTVSSTTVRWDETATILGSWAASSGDTLSVSVGSVVYTTENGLNITGMSWSLALPPMPSGRYSISARVTDRAGNVALDEDDAELWVRARPSINHARLAMARRRI